MKNITFIIIFLGVNVFAFSQDTTKSLHVKNIIWTTPVQRNTCINGIAIGFLTAPWKHADFVKVNGLNIEVLPLGAFAGIYAIWGTIYSPFINDTSRESVSGALGSHRIFPKKDSVTMVNINGISLSLGGLMDGKVSGITLNGVVCFANEMNGLELTGLMNMHYEFQGVMIAGLRNKVTKGKGLQIGIINTCKTGRVVQIGLINRIGNRITPILNFSLKKQDRNTMHNKGDRCTNTIKKIATGQNPSQT